MSKAAKSPPENKDNPAPGKRSLLRLAMFALLPLLLAGGGFAGWKFVLAEGAAGQAHAATGAEESIAEAPQPEPSHGSLPPEIAAESSFTYSFALSQLLTEKCGPVRISALAGASEDEAKADGLLVNLSWIAANRRMGTVTERSCDYMRSEVIAADARAAQSAAEKQASANEVGHGKKGH